MGEGADACLWCVGIRYAVEGQGVFDDLQKGDVIESVKVLSGMQYLKTT